MLLPSGFLLDLLTAIITEIHVMIFAQKNETAGMKDRKCSSQHITNIKYGTLSTAVKASHHICFNHFSNVVQLRFLLDLNNFFF